MAVKRKKKRTYVTMNIDEEYYENVLKPLLSMFALVDAIYTEDDALKDIEKVKIGNRRLYREWLDCREALDPTFDKKKYRADMRMRLNDGNLRVDRPKRWRPAVRGQGSKRRSATAKSPEAKRTRSNPKVQVASGANGAQPKAKLDRPRGGQRTRSRSS